MKFLVLFFICFHSIMLVKGQSSILWSKNYGGAGNEDRCYNIEKYYSSGYLLSGITSSVDNDVTFNHGNIDGWLVKIDLQGNLLWQKTFGGNFAECFYSSKIDANGDIYSVGFSSGASQQVSAGYGMKDYWVVKCDSMGNILWEKSYGGTGDEAAEDLFICSDSSIIVIGHTYSTNNHVNDHHGSGNRDLWVLKISAVDGSIIWKKCFGGSNDEGGTISQNDIGPKSCGISSHNDSIFTIVTCTRSGDGDATSNTDLAQGNLWVIVIDRYGNLLEEHSYGGTWQEFGRSIYTANDGGFIIAADSRSADGDVTGHHGNTTTYDGWLVKVDANGQMQWQRSIGGTLSDDLYDVITVDNGYYAVGRSWSSNGDCPGNYGPGSSDSRVYFIDTVGILLWSKNFGSSFSDEPYSIIRNASGNIVVAGYTSGSDYDVSNNYGPMDYWVFEYTDVSSVSSPANENSVLIYPNPTSGYLSIEVIGVEERGNIIITDIMGKVIITESTSDDGNEFDLSTFPSGVYLCLIFLNGEGLTIQKIIINR